MGMLTVDEATRLRELHKTAVRKAQEWDRTLPGTPAKGPRQVAFRLAEEEFEKALIDLVGAGNGKT